MDTIDTIATRPEQTLYWSKPHPCVFVNDERLDLYSARIAGENDYQHLISAFMDELDPRETQAVWQRALPIGRPAQILPLLICPDDVDLFCTLIVTRVSVHGDLVVWDRLGLERSSSGGPAFVWLGDEVRWFPDSTPLVFSLDAYTRMLKGFNPTPAQRAALGWTP